jgi:transposase-like protein
MMKRSRRVFSRAFKLKVVARMEAGEGGTALSKELKIKREVLYDWRKAFRAGGALALRPAGRPGQEEIRAMAERRAPASNLAEAQRQISELQRKIGEQQLDLDFFEGALQRIKGSRQRSEAPGGTVSSPRSRR